MGPFSAGLSLAGPTLPVAATAGVLPIGLQQPPIVACDGGSAPSSAVSRRNNAKVQLPPEYAHIDPALVEAFIARMYDPANMAAVQKGSCSDYGFCTEEEQRQAYAGFLDKVREANILSLLCPDAQGIFRVNAPFAGSFRERPQLVKFLQEEILDKRPEVRAVHLLVTDLVKHWDDRDMMGDASHPRITVEYRQQDGETPLPPAQLLLGMHPDVGMTTDPFFPHPEYQKYFAKWQRILQSALRSAQVAAFATLCRDEADAVAMAIQGVPGWWVRSLAHNARGQASVGYHGSGRPFQWVLLAEGGRPAAMGAPSATARGPAGGLPAAAGLGAAPHATNATPALWSVAVRAR